MSLPSGWGSVQKRLVWRCTLVSALSKKRDAGMELHSSLKCLLGLAIPSESQIVGRKNELTKWLGERAEEVGVEVYPGFAASEMVYSSDGLAIPSESQIVGRNALD
jgi:flavin-dependent dehydrogenase